MKKFLTAFLAAILALISLTGCFGFSNSSTSSKYEFVGEFDMEIDYNSYLGYGVEIKGKLKNISSREFTYVSVTFAIFDENGNQLETALDTMNHLQAGETWQFNATMLGFTDSYPESYKLVEVNAY